MIVAGNEVELREPPTDGISNVTFGPWSDSLLLSSSWDSVSILSNIKMVLFSVDSEFTSMMQLRTNSRPNGNFQVQSWTAASLQNPM